MKPKSVSLPKQHSANHFTLTHTDSDLKSVLSGEAENILNNDRNLQIPNVV
jgi:hypothetical protein